MAEVREREGRIDEERRERRRRADTTIDGGQRLKLAIPPEVEARLKAEGRVPRWINDDGNRMHNLTRLDDYDKVEGVEPRVVGTSKEGRPIYAHLCSKPAEFIREDAEKADAKRREVEQALLRGKNPGDPIAARDDFYVAEGTNIKHGGRRSS